MRVKFNLLRNFFNGLLHVVAVCTRALSVAIQPELHINEYE